MKLTHAEFAAKYPKVAQAWALCCDDNDHLEMEYPTWPELAVAEEFAAGVADLSVYRDEETGDPLCQVLASLGLIGSSCS